MRNKISTLIFGYEHFSQVMGLPNHYELKNCDSLPRKGYQGVKYEDFWGLLMVTWPDLD